MPTYTMSFYSAPTVMPEHQDLPVTQVYAWIKSSDGKIVLVSKDGHKWQFPGGKPESSESNKQTLYREVHEETGLDLSASAINPMMFGYYLVEEEPDTDADTGTENKTYLQLRFFINLNKQSDQYLFDPQDTDDIKEARFFNVDEAMETINWLPDSDELKAYQLLI